MESFFVQREALRICLVSSLRPCCRAPLAVVDLPSTPARGWHPRPHDTAYRLCSASRRFLNIGDRFFGELQRLLGEFVCCRGFLWGR
jgi:hypothetical protein